MLRKFDKGFKYTHEGRLHAEQIAVRFAGLERLGAPSLAKTPEPKPQTSFTPPNPF